MKTLAFFLLFLVPLGAAAGHVKKPEANIDKRKAPDTPPAPIILTTSAPNYCIFGGQSGKPLAGEAAFNSVIWKSDVVYVGETHDQPLDHQAQLQALKAMRIARGSKIAVGFEMLDQTLQPVLDDYLAGKLTEQEFLDKSDWKKEWGFDFGLYKPLFDFILQNKLKALALNVPRRIVMKIARAGLAGLSADEAALLPAPVAITAHKKYVEYLRESYGGHGDGPMAKVMTFENYLASMCAWNESMGARVADFLNANPGYEVLVVAGNGHVMFNAAIPASVKARVPKVRQASFYTENAAACPEAMPKEQKDLANYIWYIDHPAKAEPAPAAAPAASTAPAAAAPAAK
jgi:uncharacterized iron-regulated protein